MRFARKRPKSQVMTDRSMRGFVSFCRMDIALTQVLDKYNEVRMIELDE